MAGNSVIAALENVIKVNRTLIFVGLADLFINLIVTGG